MRELTIINPAAGKGRVPEGLKGYFTTGQNDCRRYVREECMRDPDVHFNVCGGDGTLNEAVSGVMDAGAGARASVTMIPIGSGNDTVKTTDLSPAGTVLDLDLIKVNDAYGVNMLNIGFDCNVVACAQHYKTKKGVSGSFAYIMGVAHEFFRPFGEPFVIEAECVDGSVFKYAEDSMLCAVCNGQWCGGGFHNSPYSDMTDGVIEMLLVRKVSRPAFLQLVGAYKKGTLLNEDGSVAIKKFHDVVIYKRVKKMSISGCKQICADGEIFDCKSAEISVLPGAVRYRVAPSAEKEPAKT